MPIPAGPRSYLRLLQPAGTDAEMGVQVLMVLTSHEMLDDIGRKTGFWLEELAGPFHTFKDQGAEITLASPEGGRPPLDPKSDEATNQTDATRRFDADAAAMAQLSGTMRLADMHQAVSDTIFHPGGHGPLRDSA